MPTATLNIFNKELKIQNGKRWFCKACDENVTRRISVGTPNTPTSSQTNYTLADVMSKLESLETKIEGMEKWQMELSELYEEQKTINNELRDEINYLKNEVAQLKSKRDSSETSQSTIREIDEREAKKVNLMVFGCIENGDEHNDKASVTNMIKAVCPEIDTSKIKAKRLGIKRNDRPRPIRVTLNSEQEVRSMFFKAKELIKNPTYKNYALGFDKTKQQIEEYKNIKAELERRLAKGEQNLKIKYFRNVPKIICIAKN